MASAGAGALIGVLARPAGFIVDTLRHRIRFQRTLPLPGVVTAHEPEAVEVLDNGRNLKELLMFAHWRWCFEKDLLYGCFKKFALYHLTK